MKKKGKIVVAVIGLYCAVVLGVFLGKTNFFATNRHDMGVKVADVQEEQNLIFTNDINTDVLTRHALPKFERMEVNDQNQFVNNLQVMKKIELLNLDKEGFLYPERAISNIENSSNVSIDVYSEGKETIIFQGTTSEELQEVMTNHPNAVIDIHTEQIEMQAPITLQNDTIIKGNGVKLHGNNIEYAFIGEQVSNIYINDICVEGDISYGLYFIECNNINVSDCKLNGLLQKPICIIGSTKGISISNNVMHDNQAGGLYISGDVSNGIIELNDIRNNGGTSNWMAGIVLTNVMSTDKHNIWETFDEAHHFPYKENLYAQLDCPHDIIVRNNRVMSNNASGIYSDGAYMCYVLNNTVSQNDKEGICLDYGTIGFYLRENTFDGNGQRIRQTDDDLRMDFVLDAGRMEDGSAKAKLPGVSLDNTAYNILENNIVINNYGGGIKMVRTTVRSLIMENIIKNNNMGQNDIFHFFGIEVGAAIADVESTDMDFTPDYENIICRNSITGNHYSGIFIGEECYVNDVFDNVIMEPQMFAVEAISLKFNSIVNNISNSGIRNECILEEN